MLGEHLLDGDEVLQALGHLAPSDRQVARVEEIPSGGVVLYMIISILLFSFNERRRSPSPAVVVKVSLALRQLVVMVGKLQVITTTTNTECKQRGKR